MKEQFLENLFNFLQLRCCGLDSYDDWFNVTWLGVVSNSVPGSCCRHHLPKGEICHNINLKPNETETIFTDVSSLVCSFIRRRFQRFNLRIVMLDRTISLISFQGCYRKVVDFVSSNLGAIGGGVLAVAFFQVCFDFKFYSVKKKSTVRRM